MGDFISQADIDRALKIKACREEVAMTNEELIERFFRRRVYGDEESYGFSVKPLLREPVGNCALFSKTSQFPMAVNLSKNYYIISTPFVGTSGKHCEVHNRVVIAVARQLKIKFILSPHADAANFHKYMEERINRNLFTLAEILKINPLETAPVLNEFPKYHELMVSIYTMLEGESLLELPRYQVALLDTDGVQNLWGWLIKENPDRKNRELLREMYMLSRLLGSPRREEEDRKCGLITTPSPWNKIG